jgi:hypothetical protein
MSITGSSLSADAVRSYIQSKKDEEAAKRRAWETEAKSERDKLHEAFEAREVQPEAMDRVAAVIRKAVDMGEKQALVMRFPSDWLTDQGRAITNHADNWPDSLTGFARRAYDFFKEELEPRGFQIRAEIVDWPGGMPGDVGVYLQWKHPEEA